MARGWRPICLVLLCPILLGNAETLTETILPNGPTVIVVLTADGSNGIDFLTTISTIFDSPISSSPTASITREFNVTQPAPTSSASRLPSTSSLQSSVNSTSSSTIITPTRSRGHVSVISGTLAAIIMLIAAILVLLLLVKRRKGRRHAAAGRYMLPHLSENYPPSRNNSVNGPHAPPRTSNSSTTRNRTRNQFPLTARRVSDLRSDMSIPLTNLSPASDEKSRLKSAESGVPKIVPRNDGHDDLTGDTPSQTSRNNPSRTSSRRRSRFTMNTSRFADSKPAELTIETATAERHSPSSTPSPITLPTSTHNSRSSNTPPSPITRAIDSRPPSPSVLRSHTARPSSPATSSSSHALSVPSDNRHHHHALTPIADSSLRRPSSTERTPRQSEQFNSHRTSLSNSRRPPPPLLPPPLPDNRQFEIPKTGTEYMVDNPPAYEDVGRMS